MRAIDKAAGGKPRALYGEAHALLTKAGGALLPWGEGTACCVDGRPCGSGPRGRGGEEAETFVACQRASSQDMTRGQGAGAQSLQPTWTKPQQSLPCVGDRESQECCVRSGLGVEVLAPGS